MQDDFDLLNEPVYGINCVEDIEKDDKIKKAKNLIKLVGVIKKNKYFIGFNLLFVMGTGFFAIITHFYLFISFLFFWVSFFLYNKIKK